MVMLESSREGVGAVKHPETGKRYQLSGDIPADVAEVLVSEYGFLSQPDNPEGSGTEDGEAESDSEDTDTSQAETDENAETETFRCGVNGCSRKVNSKDETCWQHEPEA